MRKNEKLLNANLSNKNEVNYSICEILKARNMHATASDFKLIMYFLTAFPLIIEEIN